MRVLLFLTLLTALALRPLNALAEPLEMSCGSAPPPVESCFQVHGRLTVQNGIPFKIWIIGTKRIVGVSNMDNLHPLLEKYLSESSRIYGDFTICPYEPDKPGHLRWVCLQAAERLVVERLYGTLRPAGPFRLLKTWPPH
jgi:hypothetical protein